MRSRIEPMKKIAGSLREHREVILNCFRAQKLHSSGVVNGLNNKANIYLTNHVKRQMMRIRKYGRLGFSMRMG
jgi:transposase